MGTSGAYGGSGGAAWSTARDQAGEYADDPTEDNANELLADIATALDWDQDTAPSLFDPEDGRPTWGQVGPRAPNGGADGPGGGGGGGRSTGTTASGGGGRSRARAASVGGSVAAAGLALRTGDADTLQRFGLSLAELEGLKSHEQARRILTAVAGSVGGIQDDELQHASGVAVLAMLDPRATADDAVRAFVTDYVFEIAITEVGNEFRDGTRDGLTTVRQEDQLRSLIETGVDQLDLPQQLDAENLQQVIYGALDEARTFLRGKRPS